jgi:5-hydroxyisourate hydrolase
MHAPQHRAGVSDMRIFTRVVDGTYGKSAAGVHVSLARACDNGWTAVADAETDHDGCIERWNGQALELGLYRIVFDSDAYFARRGTAAAYPEMSVTFRAWEEACSFQLQVTLSPYSYSAHLSCQDEPWQERGRR